MRQLIRIVAENPILRRRDFLTGTARRREPMKDITWIRPDGHGDGRRRTGPTTENQTIGMLLLGKAADEIDFRGRSTRGRHPAAAAERRQPLPFVHAAPGGRARAVGGAAQHSPARTADGPSMPPQ